MRLRRYILSMISIMSLLTFLPGCGSPGGGEPSYPAPVELPEGAELTGLYITFQGMEAGPYLFLKTTDSGTWLKISDSSPNCWNTGEEGWTCLSHAEREMEGEKAELILLDTQDKVRKLEEAVVQAGALSWDGYDVHKSGKNTSDSGERAELYLELSDGTTVTVMGYNACPERFLELMTRVKEIFYA